VVWSCFIYCVGGIFFFIPKIPFYLCVGVAPVEPVPGGGQEVSHVSGKAALLIFV
jgi:hypothetical protein